MRAWSLDVAGGYGSWDGRHLEVGGRLLEGPLRVGDMFTQVQSLDGGEHREVNLRLVEIRCYGGLLQELDVGLTAYLSLNGTGGVHVLGPRKGFWRPRRPTDCLLVGYDPPEHPA